MKRETPTVPKTSAHGAEKHASSTPARSVVQDLTDDEALWKAPSGKGEIELPGPDEFREFPQEEEEKEVAEPHVPEKEVERPTAEKAPAKAETEAHPTDARWTIPGARSERVNTLRESEHAPSHVDYLEPNRKD